MLWSCLLFLLGQGCRTVLESFLAGPLWGAKEVARSYSRLASESQRLWSQPELGFGFKAQLCHLLGVQPWNIYLSKLNLSFLICRMDVVIGSAGLLGGMSAIHVCI